VLRIFRQFHNGNSRKFAGRNLCQPGVYTTVEADAPPLCVAQDFHRCDHDSPRWGGHTTIRSTATPPVLGGPATIVGSELPGKRAPALYLFPVPVWGFSLRPSLAVQSPTRSAVPCSSNPDVTLDLGLICTNVNLLPSGAMNRSNCL